MKKSIQSIFDEAKASEVENLVSKNVASDIPVDTLSSIKNKVYAKTGIKKSQKKPVGFRWQPYAVAVACLCIIVGILFGTGVFNTFSALPPDIGTDGNILYQSDCVTVTLLENDNDSTATTPEIIIPTVDVAYTKNTVILTGMVSNVRRATVSYKHMDTQIVEYITIFDVEVSDVLACRSGSYKQGDRITMGVPYLADGKTLSCPGVDYPVIEEGKSFLIFCYVAADKENDPLELGKYLDCWISAPGTLFVEKSADAYLTNEFFADVPGAMELEKRSYRVPCNALEEHVRNTALLYKNK